MTVNYLGHSTFLLVIDGIKVLIDPFITPNNLAKHIDTKKIECDYILVTHGHQDHVADLESIAERTKAKIVSSYEVITWCERKGLNNVHPMNLGGKWHFEFGTVKMVYAAHSSVLPDGTYGGPASGFIIKTKNKTIYIAGDTALTQEMKLLADFEKVDYAFLPIGDNFTMGVSEAIIACNFINCKKVIGMHYDTFGYIKIDHQKSIKAFADAGCSLQLLPISADAADAFEI
jgi:L-ascorbate metabolism protein UlaG (beta-lactamase superfamily)